MKLRSLICVSAVAAAMSAAATTTVNGVNTFCRLPVSSPYASTIIALPFSGCGESQMQIYVTNLVMTTNLSTGDTLLWKSGSQWYGWEISSGGNWVPIASANQTTWNAGVLAEETAIPCGQACWLNRSNTSNPFYLYGQVNTSIASATAYAGTSTGPTYTLLGYPTELEDLSISSLPGSNGDTILVPADGGLGYKEYVRKDNVWNTKTSTTTTTQITRNGKTKNVSTTTVSYTPVTSADKIAAGLGFMYGRLATSDLTLWNN